MARGNTYQMAFALNARLSSSFNRSFNQAGRKINSLANTVKVAMATMLGAVGISNTVGTAFGEAMNLEGYKMQLETATKSAQKAGEIMKWSVELANSTPFETNSVVEASARLEAMGLSAQKYLPMIGDMAGATNKDLIQATEAIIDAQTGELERLKEFGIKKADIVQYAYDHMGQIQVVNNKGQITDQEKFNEAMIALMDKKFKGGMKKQAGTMKGLMSTVSGILKSGMAEAVGITSDGTIKQGSLYDELKKKIKSVADTLTKWQKDGTFQKIGQTATNILSGISTSVGFVIDGFQGDLGSGRWDEMVGVFESLGLSTEEAEQTTKLLRDAIEATKSTVGYLLDKASELYSFIIMNWTEIEPIVVGIGLGFASWKIGSVVYSAVSSCIAFYNTLVTVTTGLKTATVAQLALVKAKLMDKAETLYLKALYLGDFLKSIWIQGKAIAANALAWGVNTAQIIAQKAGLLALKAVQLVSQGVTLGLAAAQWALNAAFIASPIGWVVLAIGALIGVGVLLWKNWDKIKAKSIELWASFKTNFGGLASFFTGVWEAIKAIFFSYIESIKSIIGGIIQAFTGIIDFFKGVFTGNWKMVWQGLSDIVSGIFKSLVGIVSAPINAIISLVNSVIRSINEINVDIPEWVPVFGGDTFSLNIPEIPMFAKGTTGFNTPDTFIAGENGPELITNTVGYKVFNAMRTSRMMNPPNKASINAPSLMDKFKNVTQSIVEKVSIQISVNVDNYNKDQDVEEKAYEAARRGCEAALKKYEANQTRSRRLAYAQ